MKLDVISLVLMACWQAAMTMSRTVWYWLTAACSLQGLQSEHSSAVH
jgi:hypothetical protein